MNKITKYILSKLLNQPCPIQIPRSGELGKQVNCYSISIYNGDVPIMLVNSIEENGLNGNHFEGGGFCTEAVIPFSLYSGLSLRVDHYHGLVTHTYNGVLDYILHEWTGLYKLQSIYILAKHSVPQYFFNKRNLQLPKRMKILESIVSRQSEEPHKSFSSLDLMSYIYSIRWYLHPQKTELRKKMDLYLSSFVASGELKNNGSSFEFIITGKAIATLEQYQIETARAKSAKSANSWMLRLTAILAFFAAFQSGLIKSPVWIDLGKILEWLSLFM
ncbi:hypothetical protein [Aeromonas sp. FDAARGOS 1405]|uniref:hypothetical protein n=3 Tax=Aeromonas TaxID=642 RepID=UPI001C221466|nr:hypothetical protein [Aeromonas sp. FDAARGOS 1405]QXB28592.1 hypothetical protein I6L35_14950 [Aeromonas sp. FDAARGOS 1405]